MQKIDVKRLELLMQLMVHMFSLKLQFSKAGIIIID